MTVSTPPAHAKPTAAKLHFAVIGVVVLVAAIYQFGYPLLITLAVSASFVAIAMMVGLTALDVMATAQPRPARRARKLPGAAAQAA